MLRCPATGQALRLELRDGRHELVSADGTQRYPILDGIPMLVPRAAAP